MSILLAEGVPKMIQSEKPRLKVIFYRTAAGNEPVREWLLSLDRTDRKTMGDDVKTVQFGWPVGIGTPEGDLDLARKRAADVRKEN